MRFPLYPFVVCLAASMLAPAYAAPQRADILPPKARETVVERAKALVERDSETAALLPERPINPFDPAAGQPVVEQPTVAQVIAPARLSDDAQLRKLAGSVLPTGTISLGGEAYLLFGQKKLKVGERVPRCFQWVRRRAT